MPPTAREPPRCSARCGGAREAEQQLEGGLVHRLDLRLRPPLQAHAERAEQQRGDRGVEQWRHEQPRRQGLRRAARVSRSRDVVSHVVGGVVLCRHAQPEERRDELLGVGQRHCQRWSCSDSAPEGGAARASSVTTQCGRAAACRAERPLQPAVAEDGDALLARGRAARRWPRAMSIWSRTASASSGS